MGDRCNVYVKQAEVFLYGHWSGYDLARLVRNALLRGPDRWNDESYLARIVLDEMTKGDRGTTGFGVSHRMGDNERPVIVLDTEKMEASVTTWGYHEDDCDITKTRDPIPFAKLVEMDDATVRAWHLGKNEE